MVSIPFVGSYVTLSAGLLLFLLAAVGIGLLLSAVAATMQQAMLYSMLLIMPFSLLSGLTTPISSMPRAVQYLTAINPLSYAIDITRRVYLEGAGLYLLIADLWPLALIAMLSLGALPGCSATACNDDREPAGHRENKIGGLAARSFPPARSALISHGRSRTPPRTGRPTPTAPRAAAGAANLGTPASGRGHRADRGPAHVVEGS